MKLKVLAVAISVLASANVCATKFITAIDYEKLLPKDTNGQPVYDLRLADKVSGPYHCDLKVVDGSFVLDHNNCEQVPYTLDWKKNYSGKVLLNLLEDKSTESIEEHKLWAMAFAQAYVSSMVEMQYGLKKEGGTFNLAKAFATGEDFGHYFSRNLGPNYYVSKGLQESSLGKDIANTKLEDRDDGVLQVEYTRDPEASGSAWGELKGAGKGGFPRIFTRLNPLKVLHSNTGVARNIIGSAVTSSFYNGMVIGINTGSFEWEQSADNQLKSQNNVHKFLQGAKDADALAKMMSFMYNRGAYAAKDQVLKSDESFQHCMNLTSHMESDAKCFTQANDFGARYIRQIPDVNNTLVAAAKKDETSYDAQLTKNDIRNYIELLGRYGFYQQGDINKAKEAAITKFDEISSGDSISYRREFGKILQAMMINLPVAEFGEFDDQLTDDTKISTLTNIDSSQFYLYTTGKHAFNSWLLPNQTQKIDPEGDVIHASLSQPGSGKVECAAAIKAELAGAGGDTPLHLTLKVDNGSCLVQKVEKPPVVKPDVDGDPKKCSSYKAWDESANYTPPAKVVFDKVIYDLKWATSSEQNRPGAPDWMGNMWENKGVCE